MKKSLKVLALVMGAILLVCGSVAATLAYLLSTDTVQNTFTVGNVTITMDETDVDVYGVKDSENRVKTNEYKLVPNHTYVKDPVIHVAANSEPCYVFVKLDNQLASIIAATTIEAQMTAKGWEYDDTAKVYYKAAAIDSSANVQNVAVFDNFKVDGTLEYAALSAYADKKIIITAYAVQKDGFNTAMAAWNATFGAPATP